MRWVGVVAPCKALYFYANGPLFQIFHAINIPAQQSPALTTGTTSSTGRPQAQTVGFFVYVSTENRWVIPLLDFSITGIFYK